MSRITARIASRFALMSGVVWAGAAISQIVNTQPEKAEELIDFGDYMSIGLFLVGLILMAPVLAYLANRAEGKAAVGGTIAAAGTAILGLTCITSMANGEDLGLFMVVAPLTNAMWLFGSIALGVAQKRTANLPKALALGAPIMWVGIIPLSQFGGGVIAAAYLLALAYHLMGETEGYAGPVAAVPAR